MLESDAPATLADADLLSDANDGSPRRSARPKQIGRYPVLRELGRGGMGVVYSAYDEQLDRRVAIKVLQQVDGTATLRLQREAQAMAKLSHPNVAQIYEVGTFEGEMFLAMEFIEGETIGAWRRRTTPPIATVVHAYVQAGRGLLAAHEAGLVHRDFKPDNVMFGADDRIRVLDFGLAGAQQNDEAPDRADVADPTGTLAQLAAAAKERGLLSTPLTETATIQGTPAYMSPEQFARRPPSPASDQFSFCIALYEAIYDERPFAGGSIFELGANVGAGKVRPAPAASQVPNWLRSVIVQGLAVDPEARHADMGRLLDALQRDPTRRRRLWIVAGTLAAIAVVGASWSVVQKGQRETACARLGAQIRQTYGPDQRQPLREGMQSTGLAYAEVAFTKVQPWLDTYAASWELERTGLCIAATIDESWKPELYVRAQECFAGGRIEFETLVQRLATGDAGTVRAAVTAASRLGCPARCRDQASLATQPPIPQHLRERVADVRAHRTRILADLYSRNVDVAWNEIQALRVKAVQLGHAPLTADIDITMGRIATAQGKYDVAAEALERAFFAASEAAAEDIAAEAAKELTWVVGAEQSKFDAARRWARLGWMWLHRNGVADDDQRAASLHHALATVERFDGQYADAKLGFERAIEIMEHSLGETHPRIASSLSGLAGTHRKLGEYDKAKALFMRTLELERELYGDDHPQIASTLNNLANVYFKTGEHALARKHYERAIAIKRATLGPDHPDLATSIHNLANVLYSEGDYGPAQRAYERVLEIRKAALGPNHLEVANTLNNLGAIHYAQGDAQEALRYMSDALDVRLTTLGDEHPDVAQSLHNIATIRFEVGRFAQARDAAERALTLDEARLGPDDASHAGPRWLLAQALRKLDDEPKHAEALAVAARDVFVKSGDMQTVTQIDAWLAAAAGDDTDDSPR